MEHSRSANMRRSAPPARQAQSDTDDDDVPLAKAIPTALQAQKTIRVASHSRTQSSHGARRPRTADEPPPVPRDYAVGNVGARASDSSRFSPRSTQSHESPHQVQALPNVSKPPRSQQSTFDSPRSSGLPRRPMDETSKSASRQHGTLPLYTEPIERVSGESFPSAHQHNQGTPLRSQTRTVPPRSTPHSANRPDPARARPSYSDETQARPARTRAMTLNGASSSPGPSPSPAPKTRPPSWVDISEWSKPSSQAEPPEQTLARSHTARSRPSSPQGRPSLTSVPSTPNFRYQGSVGSLPPPYSSPLSSPTALLPDGPKPEWDTPIQMSSGMTAYKEEILAAADIAEEQRIFIETKQKYCKVKIGLKTRARDVLKTVAATGQLKGPHSDERAIGGWMVYEVANDFGMERPIREYELISDVLTAWNKEIRVNYLILKRSGLRGALSFRHMPNSSPTHEGTIQFETKKGKWSKRCLKLREHSLFLSKKDSAKDEVLLCSLSNFDGYYVTNQYRSPKPFVFAVRSTDNLSMFENPSDSVHIFSCDPAEGERWIEKIMLARSYVLYQERTTLFPSENQPSQSSSALSSLPAHQKQPQPLVTSLHHSQTQKRPRPTPGPHTTPSWSSVGSGYPSYISGPRPSGTVRSASHSPGQGYGPKRGIPPSGPLINLNTSPFAEGSLLAKASAASAL